jgi:hypothetical protein
MTAGEEGHQSLLNYGTLALDDLFDSSDDPFDSFVCTR